MPKLKFIFICRVSEFLTKLTHLPRLPLQIKNGLVSELVCFKIDSFGPAPFTNKNWLSF